MTEGMPSSLFRPCWAEIDRAALRHNLHLLTARVSTQTKILAVVKANAYGHGIVIAAEEAVKAGAAYLGVASIEEGLVLRDAGVQAPILILGSLFPFGHFSVLFDKKLTPTVASAEGAEILHKVAQQRGAKLPVHLKIDSGFGRIGVSLANGLAFLKQVAAMSGLEIEGVYTHFASSDVDAPYTKKQARAFFALMEAASKEGIRPRWVHLANSAAAIRFPETHGTLIRPGIAYYGVPPFKGAQKKIGLQPVMTLKSRVIFLKMLSKGASVSYARTWIAKRPSRIATLAVGYADGLPRLLSNRGHALISGKRVPIIGRVTMDMTMVDVTDLKECHVGDEAVLIGSQGHERISAEEVAHHAETNPYEVLARISARVPRIAHG